MELDKILQVFEQTDDGFGLTEVAKMLIEEGGWEGS